MKKLLSTIMALVMLLSLVPMAVAEEGESTKWAETKTEKSVAQVGDMYYDVLYDAVAAVEPGGTVTLLKDATGGGVGTYTDASKKDKLGRDKIVAKSFTLDFAGYTYTVSEPAVGSDGYESQGFHLEKGDGSVSVTLKNGTLASTGAAVKMLVQNYCNLTLDNMTLNGTGIELSTGAYVLSNNCGDVTIRDTTIVARNGDVAFDVYGGFQDYSDVTVTVTGNSVINGKVELARDSKYPNNKNQNKLVIVGGTINGQICKTSGEVVVKGGAFTDLASAVKYAANGAIITLAGDVALTSPVTVDKDLTIDMNGYNITANGCRALHQKQGTLNIIGKGTIAANSVADNSSSTIRVGDNNATNTADFTLGKDVTVTSDSCYGITYFGMKDETLTINGTVAVTGDATALSGNGSSKYKDVNVSVTVNGTVTAEKANAIYKPEKGTLTINGVVKGVGGIEVKSGTLDIGANAEVTATAKATSHSVNRNGCSTSGYALAAVANKSYQDNVNITVSGGKVIGQVAKVVDDADAPEGKLAIKGGTFTVNPSAFVTDETLVVVPSTDGTFTVKPKTSQEGNATITTEVSEDGKTVTETKTDGNTVTKTETNVDTGAATETKTESKTEGNVTTKTETVTEKNAAGETTKATETVTTEKTENGGKTTVVTKKDTLNKTETTEVTGVTAPTTAADVTLDVKNTTNVAVNKDSMTALKSDTVKDVIIETKDAKLTLNKTAVKTMESNVPTNGKMTLNVTVTEEKNATTTEIEKVKVEVTAKNEAGQNVFPENTANTNGLINITIPYNGNAKYLDLWYIAANASATYMGRFPVVNGFVSFDVKHFSQYDLIPVASSGSSVIKTGAGSSAASTTQTVTTDLTPGSITKVTVDGKVVDAKYYTVSGSNVTFTAEFLKTLKNGSHTVTVENATKIAKGVFTVNNPTTAQSPTTADAGIALYAGMAIASVMGTGVVFTSRKRKNH